jgi:membrane-associated phospholipid phosphatase
MSSKLLIPLLLTFYLFACKEQDKNSIKSKDYNAESLYQLNDVLTEAIILGTFSPPAAARVYAYANLAAYEIAIQAADSFKSIAAMTNCHSTIPTANGELLIPDIAIASAFAAVAKNVIWHDYLIDQQANSIIQLSSKDQNSAKISYSKQYGEEVAQIIIACMSSDGYKETRKMPFYSFGTETSSWEATPPKYAEAIEPWWFTLRPLIMDSASQFRSEPPPPFSTDPQSQFYQEALEVYRSLGKLMMDDTAVANFWDCNPYLTKQVGHVTKAIRQISPGGHWVGIAQIACRQEALNQAAAAKVLALVSIALSDAFISCWDTKYHYDLIRPITYINRYIDPKWSPLLETPPFPEYTSGHSVISAAAATVLTHLFGEQFQYEDTVEVPFGKSPRTFYSFFQASEEAAISRLYGGIHFMSAINEGKKAGRKVGELVITKTNNN